jgi:hypothetical protein
VAIPPLYNPANYGRFSVWFLSPGGSYPPVSTVVAYFIPICAFCMLHVARGLTNLRNQAAWSDGAMQEIPEKPPRPFKSRFILSLWSTVARSRHRPHVSRAGRRAHRRRPWSCRGRSRTGRNRLNVGYEFTRMNTATYHRLHRSRDGMNQIFFEPQEYRLEAQ